MAVYKRNYRAYTGRLTPEWSRFYILTRYALRNLFRSKFLTAAFVLCFFAPLVCVVGIYLNHNASVLSLLHARANQIINVDGKFFLGFLGMQCGLAFFLTAFIGPSTIAPDLSNGALPLYFCRSFTRVEYVLGKLCALFYLLSLITWVPGLILFLVEANLSGVTWMWENRSLAIGVFLGSVIWILMISLIAMALSAWVKWRIAAGALVLGVMFFLSGFGAAVNAVMRPSNIGHYINPGSLITRVCADLFGIESPIEISAWSAWVGLLVMCGICVLLLSKKVRAFEVVR
jgi:ABC-2 type transport system permease protein